MLSLQSVVTAKCCHRKVLLLQKVVAARIVTAKCCNFSAVLQQSVVTAKRYRCKKLSLQSWLFKMLSLQSVATAKRCRCKKLSLPKSHSSQQNGAAKFSFVAAKLFDAMPGVHFTAAKCYLCKMLICHRRMMSQQIARFTAANLHFRSILQQQLYFCNGTK